MENGKWYASLVLSWWDSGFKSSQIQSKPFKSEEEAQKWANDFKAKYEKTNKTYRGHYIDEVEIEDVFESE